VLHVRIDVVLAGRVVLATADRFVGGRLLQPTLVIQVQAAFVVVDKHQGGDVPGIRQHFSRGHISTRKCILRESIEIANQLWDSNDIFIILVSIIVIVRYTEKHLMHNFVSFPIWGRFAPGLKGYNAGVKPDS